MNRLLSQLSYVRIRDVQDSPRIITLHRHNQRARDTREYGLAAHPTGRVTGLESYKGVYIGREIVGYTWFVGPLEQPSPLFFGDALAEIERFLWDEIDRQETSSPELPFLIGIEQGAIMAIAAAAAVPELLSGVIAIDGSLPIVPGWSPPLAPLNALPVLLLDSPQVATAGATVLAGNALANALEDWGAEVSQASIAANSVPAEAMSNWLSAQPVRDHG